MLNPICEHSSTNSLVFFIIKTNINGSWVVIKPISLVYSIKTSGFVLNKELAEADVAEAEAKRVLAEKMTAYQAARDDYHNKSETLKKVKAKYGIK